MAQKSPRFSRDFCEWNPRPVAFSPENPFPTNAAFLVRHRFRADRDRPEGVNFQPHKLKPLLMAPSREQRDLPLQPLSRRNNFSVHSHRQHGRRITLLYGRRGELWVRSNASRDSEKCLWWSDTREEFLIFRHMTATTGTKKISHYCSTFVVKCWKMREYIVYLKLEVTVHKKMVINFKIYMLACFYIFCIYGLNSLYSKFFILMLECLIWVSKFSKVCKLLHL